MQSVDNQKKKVFVGLSGGVDSAVTAGRLVAQGYDVTGVFIKVWHPDWLVCNWEQERLDAMRVAAHLNIPFLTCDAETAYRDEVAHYFIAEYQAGRTPNPDVLCNQRVKFGAFLDFAKQHGADFIATGHYAQKTVGANGAELRRGVDVEKDQSYFLWSLSSTQLERALFPIGNTSKPAVREEAKRLGLPVADKKDSQGVCFLGHIDIPEFLSHYAELKPGAVLDENGEVIGEHQGALVYTLGQRHGFTLNSKNSSRTALYVTAKNLDSNTIVVGENKPQLTRSDTLTLRQLVMREAVNVGDTFLAQIRYRQRPFEVMITEVLPDTLCLSPVSTTDQPAVGQSCVLYRRDLCLGGGMIA